MKPRQRSLAFFCVLLLTFGISSFKFEHPEFYNNEKSYILIAAGIILLIVFIVSKVRN